MLCRDLNEGILNHPQILAVSAGSCETDDNRSSVRPLCLTPEAFVNQVRQDIDVGIPPQQFGLQCLG
jgi:hypothetical protein